MPKSALEGALVADETAPSKRVGQGYGCLQLKLLKTLDEHPAFFLVDVLGQARHFNVIPFPDELPLSFDNPALDPGPLSPAQATGGLTSDAQSTGEQRGVRSLPFRRIK